MFANVEPNFFRPFPLPDPPNNVVWPISVVDRDDVVQIVDVQVVRHYFRSTAVQVFNCRNDHFFQVFFPQFRRQFVEISASRVLKQNINASLCISTKPAAIS